MTRYPSDTYGWQAKIKGFLCLLVLLVASASPLFAFDEDAVLKAVIRIESSGIPQAVNKKSGARGLTQFMPATWADATRREFGKPLSFALAFNRETHLRAARNHLCWIRAYLARHKARWKSSEEELIYAAWFAGVGNVRKAGFNVQKMSRNVQAYVSKAGKFKF